MSPPSHLGGEGSREVVHDSAGSGGAGPLQTAPADVSTGGRRRQHPERIFWSLQLTSVAFLHRWLCIYSCIEGTSRSDMTIHEGES